MAADKDIMEFRTQNNPSDWHLALERMHVYSRYNLPPLDDDIHQISRAYCLWRTGNYLPSVEVTDENLKPVNAPVIFQSLDEALGLPMRTLRTAQAEMNRATLADKVYRLMQRFYNRGTPIDDSMFEIVGECLDISSGSARRYYNMLLKDGRGPLSKKKCHGTKNKKRF